MDFLLLVKSIGVGFLIAAPYGPVGLLTINRTLVRGAKAGVYTFLGSLLVDIFFITVLFLGISEITNFLMRFEILIKALSVLLLYGMGISMLYRKEDPKQFIDTSETHVTDFLSAFGITLANPLAYLGFLPLFGLIGFSLEEAKFIDSLEVIIGVILGIFSCWYAIVYASSKIRNAVSKKIIKNITAGVSLIMIGVATFVLMSIIKIHY